MATDANWGKARNLRLHAVDVLDEATLITTMNDWFVAQGEAEVLFIHFQVDTYGTPPVEHLHGFIIYTEE